MKYYQVPFFKGVMKDVHPRLIPDSRASDVMNILFREEAFLPRWGYAVFGGNMPLNGQINTLTLFRRNGGDMILCAFTPRDAYYYEQNTGQWKYFTRCHIAGTVTVPTTTGLVSIVTGAATGWDNTKWDAQGIYEIKFGDNDPNTAGTWYTVDTVDSATQITLTENIAAGIAGGSDYVLRLRFSGGDDDLHSVAYPYDASWAAYSYTGTEDKIMVVTNGIDPVMKWGGTGTLALLESSVPSTTVPYAKYVNYFGSKGFGHTILSWIRDGAESYPQTIETSNAGFPTQWDGNTISFYDSSDEIVGIKSLQNRMILYKSESMTEMFPNVGGGNSDPLDYNENKVRDIGTPSIRTVHDFGTYHIFLGWDNVYAFDGVSVIPIGTDLINSMIRDSNRAFLSKSFAISILSENLYCLFIPTGDSIYCDACFVYNYRNKFWTIWDLSHTISGVSVGNMTAEGYTFKESSPTWAEVLVDDIDWDEWYERWMDLLIYEDNISYLLGDSDGYIYNISPDFPSDILTYDGSNYVEDIECMLETKDYPLNDPKHTIRICELIIGMGRFSSGDLRVRASIDFGTNWSSWVAIPNTAETGDALYVEHIANFMQRGRQVRFQFENVDGADFEIESFIIGFNEDNGKIVQSNT